MSKQMYKGYRIQTYKNGVIVVFNPNKTPDCNAPSIEWAIKYIDKQTEATNA